MVSFEFLDETIELMSIKKDFSDQRNLWNEIKEGRTEAFNLLYDYYIDMLYSFGTGFSSDKELIKDSIHDLFLELNKYRKTISETDNIKNYLFKSLKRKILSNQRKKLRLTYREEVQDYTLFRTESKEDSIIQEEDSDQVLAVLNRAINKLPYRQREALVLKYKAELSYGEISEIMEISVESVRTLIYRSLKTLKESVSGKIDGSSIILFFLKVISGTSN